MLRLFEATVLFVSPPVVFPTLHELRAHLQEDARGAQLLRQLEMEIPIKENPQAIPSLASREAQTVATSPARGQLQLPAPPWGSCDFGGTNPTGESSMIATPSFSRRHPRFFSLP